jgi:sugar phosphate isomerase/epimerase
MFELGISGNMFDALPIWDHLNSARKIGYKCIELRSTHVNPETSKGEKEKIRTSIEDSGGLYISCLSCFIGNYGLLSDQECKKAFDVFKTWVDLACFMNSEMIRIWPAWQESASASDAIWQQAAKWIKKSAQYAALYNKKLVIEMHHGTICDTAPSSIRLLQMIDEKNIGVTLDPVNLYQVPADYGEKAIHTLGNYLFNVHIKDIILLENEDNPYCFAYSYYAKHIGRFAKVVPPKNLDKERYYSHRRINQGGIDWAQIIKSLKRNEYSGRLIVESVSETNKFMPVGGDLAEACYKDIMALFDSLRRVHTQEPALAGEPWGGTKGMDPESNTL